MKRQVTLSDGQEIGVIERGSGDPLVFVHGLPGQASDFLPTMEQLGSDGASWRSIAYDRVGYGSSLPIKAGRPASIDADIRTLIDLLDALKIECATLVGWSYGGHIVTSAAAEHRERVSRLVLVGATGPNFAWPPGLLERLMFKSPLGSSLIKCVRLIGSAAISPMLNDAYGARAPEHLLHEFAQMLASQSTVGRWLEEGRVWDPSASPIAKLDVPILIVHGDKDTRVPLSVAQANAQIAPHAVTKWLDGVGHWPCHSHPEQVAGILREFLSQAA